MKCIQRRARPLGAFTLMIACAACGGVPTTSAASCVGPHLNDQPPGGAFRGPTPTVNAGETLTIYGHWYTSTCNDTGGHAPLVPLPPVHLTLTLPGGAVEPLGTFTPAGQDLGFSTTVVVPAGTPAGTAKVSDDRVYPATYEFETGK